MTIRLTISQRRKRSSSICNQSAQISVFRNFHDNFILLFCICLQFRVFSNLKSITISIFAHLIIWMFIDLDIIKDVSTQNIIATIIYICNIIFNGIYNWNITNFIKDGIIFR